MWPVHCCQRPKQQLRQKQRANLESVSVFQKCLEIYQLSKKLSLSPKFPPIYVQRKDKVFFQQKRVRARYSVKYPLLAFWHLRRGLKVGRLQIGNIKIRVSTSEWSKVDQNVFWGVFLSTNDFELLTLGGKWNLLSSLSPITQIGFLANRSRPQTPMYFDLRKIVVFWP